MKRIEFLLTRIARNKSDLLQRYGIWPGKPPSIYRLFYKGSAGLALKPLDMHLVNVASIPTGPTHGEGRLQPHPGDVLKSTPKVWKSPRSGLNLEGRLSDPPVFF